MEITRTSYFSGVTRTLDLPITDDQMDKFNRRRELGLHIQHIFHNLTPGQREFILTGVTDEEWDLTFYED